MKILLLNIFVLLISIACAKAQVASYNSIDHIKISKTLVSTTKIAKSKKQIIKLNQRPAGTKTDTIIQNHENLTGLYLGVDFDNTINSFDENYVLAKIYFGNATKKEYYQLPEKYFLHSGIILPEGYIYGSVQDKLNLAYDGEKYYLFMTSASSKYSAILLTYSEKEGITETKIAESSNAHPFGYSFFEKDKQALKLYYSDKYYYNGYFTELYDDVYKNLNMHLLSKQKNRRTNLIKTM